MKKLNSETKMVVQMPSGCTAEGKCQWICDNMVGATGAKNESDYKGLNGTATTKRMLAEIKTEYTATGGYEPDSDANTEGFDTEFVDEVPVLSSSEEKGKNGKVVFILACLVIIIVAFIIVVVVVSKKQKEKTG